MIRVLRSEDHHELLSFEDAVDAVRGAFADWATHPDELVNDGRTRVFDPETGVRLTVHTGASVREGGVGSVLHTEIPDSDQATQKYGGRGEPATVLYDGETAALRGVIVGDVRVAGFPPEGLRGCQTALSTSVGIDELAREDARTVGVFGSGKQATHHLVVLDRLRDLEEARVYSPTRANREAFVERLADSVDCDLVAVDNAQSVVRGADVVLCATNASTPVFDGRLLESGQTVVSVVAGGKGLVRVGNAPNRRREIDDETVRRADLYVANSVALAREDEQGDFYHPVQSGVLEWDDVVELRDVVSGAHPGRQSEDEVVVYKQNSRQGILEAALMTRLFRAAEEADIGTMV